MIFHRTIKSKLVKALKTSPVVLLTGARQTGKTTLIKEIAHDKNYSYTTFDDLRSLTAAQADPIGFIQGLPKPAILDEVQRIPEIFLPIKQEVDENRMPGMFALTGSANPLLIPRLGDSLAGRMEILKLFPLSQGEIHGVVENFIEQLFDPSSAFPLPSPFSKTDLLAAILKGGYPPVQGLDEEARESWFNSYIEALLQRDVKDLSHISGLVELPNLLDILATRAATLLNVAELSRSSGVPSTTLQRYLTLLEVLFIVQLQPAWHANVGKRFTKAPKIYLIDSGLLAFLLNINLERAMADGKIMGAILENFVVSELLKQATWSKIRIKPYHFRTSTGIEIDTVLEDRSGSVVGIEVKASSTVTPSDFKGLRYLQEITKAKFKKGIVLYTGNQIVPFGKDLFALPLSSLWTPSTL